MVLCQYCRKNEGKKRLEENSPVIFFGEIESRFYMCDSCFKTFKKDGRLTSHDGNYRVELTTNG